MLPDSTATIGGQIPEIANKTSPTATTITADDSVSRRNTTGSHSEFMNWVTTPASGSIRSPSADWSVSGD
jgi:hypothetical protein